MKRYDSILDTIGNTPLVRLHKLAPPGVNVYVKLEAFNPMGSIKDRMALAVIEDAERRGALAPGQTVIEATSGNTGIGLAMVCARKGYPLVVTMAESFSLERRKLLRFLGARVVLTPAAAKGTGMLAKARELAERYDWFLCRQFDNQANAQVHTRTTAQEIITAFAGEHLDYWVSGFGTGGTLKGVARALRAALPATRVVAAEPDNSPLLGSGLAQPRGRDGAPNASHPCFRPHLMQGWSPDFIASLTEQAVAAGWVDEVVPVAGERAVQLSRALAREEGIFAGTSGGATLAAALTVAERARSGANIVCMLPDTGERYLSTPLFDGIEDAMNDAELTLSRSTPGYRFDTPAVVVSTPPQPSGALDSEAVALVDAAISSEPVVIFSLEWCEFCWSVRKLFARLGVHYRSIDLDAVALQADEKGGRIRAVLAQRTAAVTIPQVFVGGRPIGGSSEVFDACLDGTLYDVLADAGAGFLAPDDFNPHELLPNWLQPRSMA